MIADNTPVRTASGWKTPDKLGMDKGKFPYLLSFNPDNQCLTFEKVSDWIRRPSEDAVVIIEHTKGILVTTPMTEVLVGGFEFTPVGEVMQGDPLIFFKDARSVERKACNEHKAHLSRMLTEVKAVYYMVGYSQSMYDFRVSNYNSYTANGLILKGF